jgi:PPOX class probable F420-dependent enzyme
MIDRTNIMAGFRELAGQRYLSLETYRRTGVGVRTPVWFAAAPDTASGVRLYVYADAESGKVKRIRRSEAVKIAPSDMRGTVRGDWVSGSATLVLGDEFERGMRLLNRKYWPWKSMLDVFSRLRPGARRAMIVIRPA